LRGNERRKDHQHSAFFVITGPARKRRDPVIHSDVRKSRRFRMDRRVKPGNDEGRCRVG
jgi:hypothetical protein